MAVFVVFFLLRVASGLKVLPVYSPNYEKVFAPVPIPGQSTKLCYEFSRPTEVAFVRDVRKVGEFVQVVSATDDDDPFGDKERVGVVVEVSNADVAEDGSKGALVGRAAGRCLVRETTQVFPYQAATLDALEDTLPQRQQQTPRGHDDDDILLELWRDLREEEDRDPLDLYDIFDPSNFGTDLDVSKMQCYETLDYCLKGAALLDPNFGKLVVKDDDFNDDASSSKDLLLAEEGEFERMRRRLREAYTVDDHTHFGFVAISMAGLPHQLACKALASTDAARRYAFVANVLRPLAREFAGLHMTAPIAQRDVLPPRPAPFNAPPSLALLRPGRRLRYWLSDDAKWQNAKIIDNTRTPKQPHDPPSNTTTTNDDLQYVLEFEKKQLPSLPLPLDGVDRHRFQIIPH